MNMNKENKPYKTSDLGLTTALSLNFPIKSLDKSNPRKVFFIFDHTNELDNFINKYWEGRIIIEPQTFINQIKSIKSRIYESS